MISQISAFIRLSLFICWTLLCLVPYLAIFALGDLRATFARRYWRTACRIAGLKPVVFGQMAQEKPVLFVVNHVSYLDILVLGGLLNAIFVAKSEVAGWPGINLIAWLGRTVFIERKPRLAVGETAKLTRQLKAGQSLIVFPEGTSSDGHRVLPFKSALFTAAETLVGGQPILVQPVSITYTLLNGVPMGRAWRPLYAWYGDMTLVPHLWKVLGLGQAQVEVEFHKPVRLTDYASRKTLALHCHRVVRHGVSRAITGRRPEAVSKHSTS
ncbi:MAG: 1-acyl-sn-glycerol-3-phosphate acyltransferase [Alphaproteobacteria bacterium]|nr:1-acyl-sn-glycerol-3-phosphate acyltransferase [Alphaproteobacteria bacterium]